MHSVVFNKSPKSRGVRQRKMRRRRLTTTNSSSPLHCPCRIRPRYKESLLPVGRPRRRHSIIIKSGGHVRVSRPYKPRVARQLFTAASCDGRIGVNYNDRATRVGRTRRLRKLHRPTPFHARSDASGFINTNRRALGCAYER